VLQGFLTACVSQSITCNSIQKTCVGVSNALFVILHPSLVLMFIYHTCKSSVTKQITLHRVKSSFPCILINIHQIKKKKKSRLDDWVLGFNSWWGAGNFSLHNRIQNGSGANPASYQMGTRGFFSGDKAAGA